MMKMSYRLSRSKTMFADEGHVWLDCCTHKHMQMHTHTPDEGHVWLDCCTHKHMQMHTHTPDAYSCTCCSCLVVQDFYDLISKLF